LFPGAVNSGDLGLKVIDGKEVKGKAKTDGCSLKRGMKKPLENELAYKEVSQPQVYAGGNDDSNPDESEEDNVMPLPGDFRE